MHRMNHIKPDLAWLGTRLGLSQSCCINCSGGVNLPPTDPKMPCTRLPSSRILMRQGNKRMDNRAIISNKNFNSQPGLAQLFILFPALFVFLHLACHCHMDMCCLSLKFKPCVIQNSGGLASSHAHTDSACLLKLTCSHCSRKRAGVCTRQHSGSSTHH